VAEQDQEQPEAEVQGEQVQSQAEAADSVAESGVSEGGGEEGESPSGELSLEEMVAQLQEDVAEAKDAAVRAQADAQNIQRRAEQDVEKARKFALERFCSELLPVADNLERALEAAAIAAIDDEIPRVSLSTRNCTRP